MATQPSWVEKIFGRLGILQGGSALASQPNLNITGDGVAVTPDPTNGANKITIPGGTTLSKVVDASSPAITQGYGVMQKNGRVTLAQQSALGTSLYIAGIALVAATANSPVQLITHGPIDPTVINVDAGDACAVGLDASAKPVRVTDPTCVTKLKVLGYCDTNGAIYVAPHVADGFRLDDYGGVDDPTGGTMSDAAFDAMVAAAIAASTKVGAKCVIPSGTFNISSTKIIRNVFGLKMVGEGSASKLNWKGNATDAALLLSSCYACTFADFGIGAAQTLAIGVQLTTWSGVGHHISTRNTFKGFGVGGVTTEVQECVVIGGDLDANNDFHVFNECSFANYNKRAIRIGDSQSYQHRFINSFFQPLGFTTSPITNEPIVGTMASGSPNLAVTTDTFTAADVGKFVEVATALDGTLPLRTTVLTVTDARHVVLDVSAGADATSVAVCTGAAEAIRGDKGSYTVEGGGSGNHLNTVFYQSNVSSQAVTIRDFADEGSRGLLRSSGPSSGTEKMALIDCVRFAGDGAIAGVPCIQWNFSGQLEVRNSQLGDYGVDLHITCEIGSPAFNQETMSVKFTNVIFASAGATKAEDIFPTGIVPSLQNCHIYSGSFVGDLPDVNMQNESWQGEDVLRRVKSNVGYIHTTDATTTTALAFTVPDDTAVDFCFTVLAKDQLSGDTYRCDHRVTYTKHSSAPTLIGSLVSGPPASSGALVGAVSTVDVSSDDIRVRVTGIAATNIAWSVIQQAQTVRHT